MSENQTAVAPRIANDVPPRLASQIDLAGATVDRRPLPRRPVRPDGCSTDPRPALRDRRIGIALVLIPSSIAPPTVSRRPRRGLRAGWIAAATHPAESLVDRLRLQAA